MLRARLGSSGSHAEAVQQPSASHPVVIMGEDTRMILAPSEEIGLPEDMELDTHVLLIENAPPSLARQRTLDEVLATVDRVRVRPAGMSPGSNVPWPVLVETDDPAALADLWLALRLGAGALPIDSLLGPSFELFAGDTLVATLSLQQAKAIRWSRWSSDAPLRSTATIHQWLVDRGLDEDLLDLLLTDPGLVMAALGESSSVH